MLVLARKIGQAIHIGNNVRITVTRAKAGEARLAIEAPDDLRILREELLTRGGSDANSGRHRDGGTA